MSRLVFLLEEQSMQTLLDGLLPRIFPSLSFLCIPHEGKSDLEKSIPRKLRGWNVPGDTFIVVRDQDAGDCREVKAGLVQLCANAGRPGTVVRIACRELEAWYFGEPEAVAEAYGDAAFPSKVQGARFRVPDEIVGPSKALSELVPDFQKVSGARRMAEHLTRERNRSRSFQVFLESVRQAAAAQEAAAQAASFPPTSSH